MQTPGVSTRLLFDLNRTAVRSLSAELARAQTETTTGRLADTGQTLGARARASFSARQEIARLSAIGGSNSAAATRLETTQRILTNATDTAQDFISGVIAAKQSSGNQTFLPDQARANVVALTASVNSASAGAYLFGGINSENAPLGEYYTPGSPQRNAVTAAFQSAFGVLPSDAGAATITKDAMQTFLDGAFASLFSPANWETVWSSAANQNLESQISPSEVIETSANANEGGIRTLMSAYVMVAEFGGKLSDETFQAVLETAARVAGEAVQGITSLQSKLGIAQNRIASADDRMSRLSAVLGDQLGALEGVDPFEAASRVTELTTRLETAYALTARLERLNLLNYL